MQNRLTPTGAAKPDVWTVRSRNIERLLGVEPVSLGRQSVCRQRGTHRGLGSPSDTLEECFLPA